MSVEYYLKGGRPSTEDHMDNEACGGGKPIPHGRKVEWGWSRTFVIVFGGGEKMPRFIVPIGWQVGSELLERMEEW